MNEPALGGYLGTGNLDAHIARFQAVVTEGTLIDDRGDIIGYLLRPDGQGFEMEFHAFLRGPPDFDREWRTILEEMRRLKLK